MPCRASSGKMPEADRHQRYHQEVQTCNYHIGPMRAEQTFRALCYTARRLMWCLLDITIHDHRPDIQSKLRGVSQLEEKALGAIELASVAWAPVPHICVRYSPGYSNSVLGTIQTARHCPPASFTSHTSKERVQPRDYQHSLTQLRLCLLASSMLRSRLLAHRSSP
jgi:hypothetical protein